jgi:hypothetical protein
MPHCYLIALAAGSSLDQQSNNITLFNLVEQVNIPPGVTPAVGTRIPLEIHAYVRLDPQEIGQPFEMRFALVSSTGLETFTDPVKHRSTSSRLRTRALGVPFPPAMGHYNLCVDFRRHEEDEWTRDRVSWPIAFLPAEQKPRVTH